MAMIAAESSSCKKYKKAFELLRFFPNKIFNSRKLSRALELERARAARKNSICIANAICYSQ